MNIYDKYNDIFYNIQILHIITKTLQSYNFTGTKSFSVPGNQPERICPKVN